MEGGGGRRRQGSLSIQGDFPRLCLAQNGPLWGVKKFTPLENVGTRHQSVYCVQAECESRLFRLKSKIFFSRYLTESSGTKYETKQNFAKLGEGLAIINQNKVKRTETLYVKVRVHGLGSLQAFFVGLWRSPYNISTLTFVQYYSVTPWRYIQHSARKKPYCTVPVHFTFWATV